MNTLEIQPAPHPQETLADYVQRVRSHLGLSQRTLAERAGIHLQSVGKLERGKTAKLNRKTQSGLAYALQIPIEYLEAVERSLDIAPTPTLKFCPQCWSPPLSSNGVKLSRAVTHPAGSGKVRASPLSPPLRTYRVHTSPARLGLSLNSI